MAEVVPGWCDYGAEARLTKDICDVGNQVHAAESRLGGSLHATEARLAKDICDAGNQANHIGSKLGEALHATEARLTKNVCDVESAIKDGVAFVSKTVTDGDAETLEALRAEARGLFASIASGFKEVVLEGCKNTDEINRGVAVGFKDTAVALATGFKDVEIGFGRTATQAEKIAAASALASSENTYKILLDASKNAAAAQLEAQKNAMAISAQLAECCCELKEKISGEGETTRALMNTIESGRVAQLLSDAKAEILYLRNRVPTGTPV